MKRSRYKNTKRASRPVKERKPERNHDDQVR